jgi:hypothetical protein
MPLMSRLIGQASQKITRHIDANSLLLHGEKVRDSTQMAHREAIISGVDKQWNGEGK